LRQANSKFERRFRAMEAAWLPIEGHDFSQLDLNAQEEPVAGGQKNGS
jgi:ATP diphosphatase